MFKFLAKSCKQMVHHFYSVITNLLDYHMPVVRTSVNNLNKPWVTERFQQLVRRRQRAFFTSKPSPLYCKLWNKVNCTAASLHKKYYARKIETYTPLMLTLGGRRQNSFCTVRSRTRSKICNDNTLICH